MKKLIHHLDDSQHIEAVSTTARIRAIADAIMQVDMDGEASSSLGLLQGTLFNLADSVVREADSVSEVLGSTITETITK